MKVRRDLKRWRCATLGLGWRAMFVVLPLAAVLAGAPIAHAARALGTGSVREYQITSRHQGRSRHVWVYTPPGYTAARDTSLGMILAFDGAEYLELEQGSPALPRLLTPVLQAAGLIARLHLNVTEPPAWAMPAGWPDSDDTAYTILALRALGLPASAPAMRRGARWLEGMQNTDGSWPTFVNLQYTAPGHRTQPNTRL